jgi:hypothetical protein
MIPTAAPAARSAQSEPELASDLTTIGSPAPATVAGGAANGSGQPAPVQPQPVAASRSAAPEPSTTPPPPRIQIRPTGAVPPGRRPPLPGRQPAPEGPSSGRRIVVGLLLLLVLAGVTVGLVLLTQGGGGSSTAASSSTARTSNTQATRQRTKAGGGVTPSAVTVSVLNGTATAQLAHRVAQRLAALGYKQGNVATAADQTRTATVIAYLPGHRRDALAIASSLKLGPASVQPIDANTQAVACPPSTQGTAGGVATVGSDLANTP